MITNLVEGSKIKCQQYWPEGGAQAFGPFQITITDQQTLADYTLRHLLVQVCLFSLYGVNIDVISLSFHGQQLKGVDKQSSYCDPFPFILVHVMPHA